MSAEQEPLKAGRKLDALIAEKVMKLHDVHRDETGELLYYDKPKYEIVLRGLIRSFKFVPHYSTNSDAARDVYHAFDAGCSSSKYSEFGESHTVRLPTKHGWCSAEADTLPLAICLAALKAIEE